MIPASRPLLPVHDLPHVTDIVAPPYPFQYGKMYHWIIAYEPSWGSYPVIARKRVRVKEE